MPGGKRPKRVSKATVLSREQAKTELTRVLGKPQANIFLRLNPFKTLERARGINQLMKPVFRELNVAGTNQSLLLRRNLYPLSVEEALKRRDTRFRMIKANGLKPDPRLFFVSSKEFVQRMLKSPKQKKRAAKRLKQILKARGIKEPMQSLFRGDHLLFSLKKALLFKGEFFPKQKVIRNYSYKTLKALGEKGTIQLEVLDTKITKIKAALTTRQISEEEKNHANRELKRCIEARNKLAENALQGKKITIPKKLTKKITIKSKKQVSRDERIKELTSLLVEPKEMVLKRATPEMLAKAKSTSQFLKPLFGKNPLQNHQQILLRPDLYPLSVEEARQQMAKRLKIIKGNELKQTPELFFCSTKKFLETVNRSPKKKSVAIQRLELILTERGHKSFQNLLNPDAVISNLNKTVLFRREYFPKQLTLSNYSIKQLKALGENGCKQLDRLDTRIKSTKQAMEKSIVPKKEKIKARTLLKRLNSARKELLSNAINGKIITVPKELLGATIIKTERKLSREEIKKGLEKELGELKGIMNRKITRENLDRAKGINELLKPIFGKKVAGKNQSLFINRKAYPFTIEEAKKHFNKRRQIIKWNQVAPEPRMFFVSSQRFREIMAYSPRQKEGARQKLEAILKARGKTPAQRLTRPGTVVSSFRKAKTLSTWKYFPSQKTIGDHSIKQLRALGETGTKHIDYIERQIRDLKKYGDPQKMMLKLSTRKTEIVAMSLRGEELPPAPEFTIRQSGSPATKKKTQKRKKRKPKIVINKNRLKWKKKRKKRKPSAAEKRELLLKRAVSAIQSEKVSVSPKQLVSLLRAAKKTLPSLSIRNVAARVNKAGQAGIKLKQLRKIVGLSYREFTQEIKKFIDASKPEPKVETRKSSKYEELLPEARTAIQNFLQTRRLPISPEQGIALLIAGRERLVTMTAKTMAERAKMGLEKGFSVEELARIMGLNGKNFVRALNGLPPEKKAAAVKPKIKKKETVKATKEAVKTREEKNIGPGKQLVKNMKEVFDREGVKLSPREGAILINLATGFGTRIARKTLVKKIKFVESLGRDPMEFVDVITKPLKEFEETVIERKPEERARVSKRARKKTPKINEETASAALRGIKELRGELKKTGNVSPAQIDELTGHLRVLFNYRMKEIRIAIKTEKNPAKLTKLQEETEQIKKSFAKTSVRDMVYLRNQVLAEGKII